MRRTVTIPLPPDEEIKTHNGMLKAIVLREPTYGMFMEFGDPYTIAGGNGGAAFAVENIEAIQNYIAACLVEPKDSALLQQASVRIGREVKNAMLGFFQPAEPEGEGPETSPTNSPSADSASTPGALES